MITVVVAVALILVGLSATVSPLDFVNAALDVVQDTIGTNLVGRPRSAGSSSSPATRSSSPARCCRGSGDGARMNFAPRMPTIIVALALVLIGLLGTFVGACPTSPA